PTDADRYALQLRRREAWFDSIYIWVPAQSQPYGAPAASKIARGSLVHPTYPASEDTRRILLNPCLGRAKAMSILDPVDPLAMARLYLQGCQNEPIPVRLVAATEAATLLRRAGLEEDALDAL